MGGPTLCVLSIQGLNIAAYWIAATVSGEIRYSAMNIQAPRKEYLVSFLPTAARRLSGTDHNGLNIIPYILKPEELSTKKHKLKKNPPTY